MVITGVLRNPGSDEETLLSMSEAVSQGLLDLENGLYRNTSTNENMSMIEAMNRGYIKVSILMSEFCCILLIGKLCLHFRIVLSF